MERKFEIEAPSQALPSGEAAHIEVTINVWCTDTDGEYGWEPVQLWDIDRDAEVPSNAMTAEEMSLIEERAEKLAYETAGDAYQEYCEGRADVEYERWKDEQMFLENEE